MATVNLLNVSKQYGKQPVLSDINLSVEKGEFLAIVGASGCGKSTLLRLVAGLEDISQGQILINNICINQIPAHRRDMAMVFQSYALYPHMTVFENMAYGLKMRGLKKAAITKQVHEVAALLQLTDFLARKPNALSGGQRQRVAMGRAIVRSPAVFLFDEPLSNLDTNLRNEMRYEIKKLHQELRITSLYVTHDQTEAMTMASRILILNQGKIEQLDTPQTIYQRPASMFVANFMGAYPMNFIEGELNNGQFKSASGLEYCLNQPKIANQSTTLAIRPEHINLCARSEGDMPVRIQFVDDLGADKLVHVSSLCGIHQLSVRVLDDQYMQGDDVAVKIDYSKANLYHQNTGLRLENGCESIAANNTDY